MPNLTRALVFSLVAIACTPAFATDYFVRKSGSERNSGRTKDQAFATLQQAVSVASGNDRIFIGAGNYTEQARRSTSNTGSALLIYGDTDGGKTGDRGTVSIEAVPNQYALRIYGGGSVSIENINFASQRQDAKGHGVYARQAGKVVEFQNCKFENLSRSIHTDQTPQVAIRSCDFRNSLYAILASTCESLKTESSGFSNCYYGVYSNNCSTSQVSGCKFVLLDRTTDEYTPYAAIRSTRGDLDVQNIATYGIRIGVYGSSLSKASIRSSQFEDISSWGVLVQGDVLEAGDLDIRGIDKRGWGISLESSVARPTIEGCRLSGLTGGLYSRGLPCKYAKVVSTGNSYGLYVTGTNVEYVDKDMSGLVINDNRIGAYFSPNSQTTRQITLQGLLAEKNDYGVLIYGDANIVGSKILDNLYGLTIYRATKARIQDCTIVGNDADSARSIGLRIQGDDINISDSISKNNRIGVYLQLTGENSPVLSNLQSIGSTTYGLYVLDGNLSLSGRDKFIVDGGTYGLYTSRTNVKIDSWAPQNSDYAYTLTYGSASVNNVAFSSTKQPLRSHNQTNLDVTNFKADGSFYNAMYISGTQSVALSKCRFAGGARNGLVVYNPGAFKAEGIEAVKNTSYGFYLTSTTPLKHFSVTESNFEGNGYGWSTRGVDCTPATFNNSRLVGNRYGLRVDGGTTELSEKSQLTIEDNYYGVMSYNGKITASNTKLSGNDVGFLAQNSPLLMTDCKISSRRYGVLLYSGDSQIERCSITDSAYGIYFTPRDNGNTLDVWETEISGTSTIAFLASKSGSNTPDVKLKDVKISKTRYGVYANTSNVEANNVRVDAASAYAIYQNGGKHLYEDFTVTGGASWAVYSNGDAFTMRRGDFSSRYGIYLRSTSSQLINSVVKDSYYGVYANNPSGKHEILQSTIGNISTYGVFLASGEMSVTNTIVDSARYGLYKTPAAGKLTHDYNLISATTNGFVNETAGLHEIEKKPIFMDPLKGDLHLAAGSPAINAGMDLSHVSKADIEGNARPSFRQFEMGAYEFTEHAGSLRILDWAEQAK